MDECKPSDYAAHLATYIADPSTIWARTMDARGTAPSLARCRDLRAMHLATKPQGCTRLQTTLRCGHGIDQLHLMIDGNERCNTCDREKLDAVQAKAAAAERKRVELTLAKAAERKAAQAANKLVADILTDPARPRLVASRLARAASIFGLTVAEITGRGKTDHVVDCRAVLSVAMRQDGLSYPQIGQILGGRDHSTIIHLCDTFAKRIDKRPYLRDALVALL